MEPTGGQVVVGAVKGMRRHGCDQKRTLVVGFSGGGDSTALLAGLAREFPQMPLVAAYFDHRLSATSKRDTVRARAICKQVSNAQFVNGTGDTIDYARRNKYSLEEAGRELRYRFLRLTTTKYRAQGLAVGHTANDQAETVLFNILRGAGLRGLAGMRILTHRPLDGCQTAIWRPLLKLSHADCVRFCKELGVEYIQDQSNCDLRFTRNRIRHELLPLANSIQPAATRALNRLAKNAGNDLNIVEQLLAEKGFQPQIHDYGVRFTRVALVAIQPNLRHHAVLLAWRRLSTGQELSERNVHGITELACSKRSGLTLHLPGRMQARTCRQYVTIGTQNRALEADLPPTGFEGLLAIGGHRDLGGGYCLSANTVKTWDIGITTEPGTAYVVVTGDLFVRSRRPGDRFNPLGLRHSVKLQDFFVNSGTSRWLRDRVPLVTSERGIVWVAGHRIADWAKVRADSDGVVRLELTKVT